MRKKRSRTGISTGTAATLVFFALVVFGSVLLFPKLLGQVEQRVSPQQVGVALEKSLRAFGDTVLGQETVAPSATAPPAAGETPAPQVSATPAPAQRLTLTAAGELHFDRDMQTAATSDTGYTFDFQLEQLKTRLTGDINLVTLQNVVLPQEKLTNVNMPSAALTAMANAGFNVVCTGFYGALNGGVDGLNSTLSLIQQNGMLPYGTYLSEDQRSRVVTKDVNGVTVAFLSFQGELSAEGKKATTKEEQGYVFAPLTLPAITAEISAARAAGAKIVVVSLCWGREGAAEPTKLQTEMANGIASAGADIILGTNPGVLQKVEILSSARADGSQRQTLCAYSLGSVLNSDRSDRSVITSVLLTMALRYDLETDVLTFETITYSPVYIWRGRINGKTAYQPVFANEAAPAYVDDDQESVMLRALADVRALFENTLIQER